jgi:replicative DNA helicase
MASPRTIEINELDTDIIGVPTDKMYNPEQGGQKTVVIGKPGCFLKGTKILMFDGTVKNVEDIQVGEKVMGDDSFPRNVLELCRNHDKMYRIKPENGNSVTVNKSHILSLIGDSMKDILDITVEDYLKSSKNLQDKYKWFRVGVDFPEDYSAIEPYTVGFVLENQKEAIPYSFIVERNKEMGYTTNRSYIKESRINT